MYILYYVLVVYQSLSLLYLIIEMTWLWNPNVLLNGQLLIECTVHDLLTVMCTATNVLLCVELKGMIKKKRLVSLLARRACLLVTYE